MSEEARTRDPSALKCILAGIPVTETFQPTTALEFATKLASVKGAALSLYALPPLLLQPFPLTAGTSLTWVDQEVERLERLSSATLQAATEFVSRTDVELVTEQAHSPFERRGIRFVQLARTHDLTVLDAADAADESGRNAIEDALFDSGRPVIIVPAIGSSAAPAKIAIAWDGSSRAARAVKDALEFLGGAGTVIVLTVTEKKDLSSMAPGADLSAYLIRHGLTCKSVTLAADDAGSRIRSFVAEEGIDMLVMGAFAHSRFREAVLGGVTRSLLDGCPAPVFMAH